MTDYNKWKVTDLKTELKKRGLLQTGVKSLLIARLEEAENKEEIESEETIQHDSVKLDNSSTTVTSPDTATPALAAENLPETQTPTDSTVTELPHRDTVTNQDAQEICSNAANEPEDRPAVPKSPQISEKIESPESNPHATEESCEDRQKRKRSSQSPASPVAEASPKRLRIDENSIANDNDMDCDVAQTQEIGKSEERNDLETEVENNASPISDHAKLQNDLGQECLAETTGGEEALIADTQETIRDEPPQVEENNATSEPTETPTKPRRDSRFKGLFNGGDNSNETDSLHDDSKPERSVSPAIHPATSALYIRDMQRPLSPQQFRFHLSALAAPPGNDPAPELILSFYLDPIRTHAFISFASISAASRVRTALHSRVWPDERNRKPLWVDFVPEDKIEDWILQEQESNTGGRSMAKKWEVFYDIGEDRQVTTCLQEASNVPLPAQHHTSSVSQHSSNQIPLGPRSGIDGAPSGPRAHYSRTQHVPVDIGGSKLNELFNATTTKPVLYWKPVSKDLANKRLDCIEDSYSSEVKAGGRVIGDPHRYTFEEGAMLVDRGVELVPGLRPPPGYRAPRPMGDRGGYSGGAGWRCGGSARYRGRGGGGGYRGSFNDRLGYRTESRGARDYGRH